MPVLDPEGIYRAVKYGLRKLPELTEDEKNALRVYFKKQEYITKNRNVGEEIKGFAPAAKPPLISRILSIGQNADKIAKYREVAQEAVQAGPNAALGKIAEESPFSAGLVKGMTLLGEKPEKAPLSYTAGEMVGSLLPFGAAYKGAGLLTKGITKAIPRIAATGALAGAPVGAAQAAVEGGDIKDIAKRALLYAGLGAAGDVAVEAVLLPVLKPVAQKVIDKFKNKPVIADVVEKEVAKEIGVDWNDLNETQKKTIRRVVGESTGRKAETVVSSKKAGAVETGIIKKGEKGRERGFSRNVRTDTAMNDNIRAIFEENPLMYEQLSNPTTLAKAQSRFAKGYEMALSDWKNSLDTFRADDVPLARMLANEAANRGDLQTAREIIADVADKLTQAGQFTQAARILRQAKDPESILIILRRYVSKINKQGAQKYGDKWKDVDIPAEIEQKVRNNWNELGPNAREAIMEEMADKIAKQMPSSGMEKFDAWRRVAMLFNPKTHIRNIGGNVTMMQLRKTADTIGAGLERLFGVPVGERTKAIGWSLDKNLREIVSKEWEMNKKDLLKYGRWDIESFRFLQKEKPVFKSQTLQALSDFTKKALDMGDVPFMKRAYEDALGQYMKANKLTEVTQAARDYAKRRALEATYREANRLSSLIQQAKGWKGIGWAVEAAIPFSKTPANIAARAFEYSPAGLLKALYSKAAGKTAAEVIEDLSKGLTGSAMTALGFLLADMGWIRGEKRKSKYAEAALQQSGEQPYSFITPLGSYTFDWALPSSIPFAMGVILYESLRDKENIDMEAIVDAIAKSGDVMFDQSMLQTFRRVLGGDYGSVTEALAELPASYVSQAWPTLFGQIARIVDPTKRSTYDTNPAMRFVKSFAAKTPFVSKMLEPRLDIYGREQKQAGALQQLFSPGFWKEKENDPVTQEIVRLYKLTGETDILPKVAPLSFYHEGKKITLLPNQVTQFQREMGQKNYEDIKKYLQSFPRHTDEQKAHYIARIVKRNYDKVKKKFIPKNMI